MGPEFYSKLSEHEKAVLRRKQEEERERLQRQPEKSTVAAVPAEYRTKARKEVLTMEEQERQNRIHAKEIALEKRNAALAYADEVKRNHRPPAKPEVVSPRAERKQRLSAEFEKIGKRKQSRERRASNAAGDEEQPTAAAPADPAAATATSAA